MVMRIKRKSQISRV